MCLKAPRLILTRAVLTWQWVWSNCEIYWQEKPVSVLLCPPQISRGLAQNRARQLMARAMVRTKTQNSPFLEILTRPAHGRNKEQRQVQILLLLLERQWKFLIWRHYCIWQMSIVASRRSPNLSTFVWNEQCVCFMSGVSASQKKSPHF
jgi:hypothetical protein